MYILVRICQIYHIEVKLMNLFIDQTTRDIDIWLMAKEKDNEETAKILDIILNYCKGNNLHTTVFISGGKDLNETTLSLLINQIKGKDSA